MTSSFTSGQMHEAEIVSERVRKILGDRESQDLAIAAMTYTTALLKYEEQWLHDIAKYSVLADQAWEAQRAVYGLRWVNG